jgi:hypothetical protein
MLHRFVETFRGRIILATTHKNEMDDALINRFIPYALELKRPTEEQASLHLNGVAKAIGIVLAPRQVAWIARSYGCDMRKCINFLHGFPPSARGNQTIMDEYLNLMLPHANTEQLVQGKEKVRL